MNRSIQTGRHRHAFYRLVIFLPVQSLSQLIISVGGESNVGPSRLGIHKKLSVSLFSLARFSKDLAWRNGR